MGECVRIPLYSQRKKLLGYWAMRQTGDTYRVSFRYPGQKHKKYETDDPEHAVGIFYNAYIGFLGKKLSEIDNQLAELPKQEYRKPGFRKGWLSKLRSALCRDKESLVRETRKVLAEKLSKLREVGWPQPPLPKLPWGDVDGAKAAQTPGVVFISEGVGGPSPGAVSPGGATDQRHHGYDGPRVHVGEADSGGQPPTCPGSWSLHVEGGGSSGLAADEGAAGRARRRADAGPFAQPFVGEVWHFPGTGPADCAGDTGSDGEGASEAQAGAPRSGEAPEAGRAS